MVAPPYCRASTADVFRIVRSSELVAPDRVRFALRALPINPGAAPPGPRVAREFDRR